MSSGDERSKESSPTIAPVSNLSSRESSEGSTSRQTSGPANIIEFVDSQDPNVKSAIQRHTAYHSAAQRRNARLRSLRRGSQPRVLEWGRRPSSEPPNKSSASSTGTSLSKPASPEETMAMQPAEGLHLGQNLVRSPNSASAPHSRSISPRVPLSSQEEHIIQSYLGTICSATASQLPQDLVAFIRIDDASTQLLLAYCHAFSAQQQQSADMAVRHRGHAQQYFGRGTNILWNRLRDPIYASSDANIQAVLLLVAYASDFGQPGEVEMHADALRTMVAQRTQTGVISNPTLRGQLESIQTSRRFHLTFGLDHECVSPRRFPDGFWQTVQRPPG